MGGRGYMNTMTKSDTSLEWFLRDLDQRLSDQCRNALVLSASELRDIVSKAYEAGRVYGAGEASVSYDGGV